MASNPEAFAAALHRLIDALEDATLQSAQALTEAIEKIEPRVWLQLARDGRLDALTQTLGVEISRQMLPAVEAAALETATVLSGRNALAVIPKEGARRLWGEVSARRAAVRTTSLLADEMTTAQNRIQRILGDTPEPTTRAEARAILDRIGIEVIAPLRSPGVWQESLNAATMTAGDEALGAAAVRLADPVLQPDAAHQRAQDMPHAWVCALIRTCPDCLSRHGQIDTAANWRRRGMPRSGWSVCGGHCRCQVIPVFDGGEIDVPTHAKIIEPLRREKMALVKEGSPRGLTVAVPADLLREDPHTLKGKEARREALRKRYEDDIRVRRAMRLLGQINAE